MVFDLMADAPLPLASPSYRRISAWDLSEPSPPAVLIVTGRGLAPGLSRHKG
jgi:hypothetical protein